MDSDPIVKLQQERDTKRISVRFVSRTSVDELFAQVSSSGAFYLKLDGEMPSSSEIPVLMRTARRGEQFPATILAWSRGTVALKPEIPTADFEELTRSLARALERESDESGLHVRTRSDESVEIPDARELLEREPTPLRAPHTDPPEPTASSAEQAAHPDEKAKALAPAGILSRPITRPRVGLRKERRPSQPIVPLVVDEEPEEDEEELVSHDTPTKDLSRPTPRPLAQLDPPGAESDNAPSKKGADMWRRTGTDAHRPIPTRHPEARRGDFSPPSPGAESGEGPPPPPIPPPPPAHPATLRPTSQGGDGAAPEGAVWESDEHVAVDQDRGLLETVAPAFEFLQRLPLAPDSISGVLLGDGQAAIDALATLEPGEPANVLLAEDLEDERAWFVLTAGGLVVNAYRVPVVGSASLIARLHLQGMLTRDEVETIAALAEREGCAEERALMELPFVDRDTLARIALAKVKWITGELASAENVEFRTARLLRRPDQGLPGDQDLSGEDLRACIAGLERKSLNDIAVIHEDYLDRPPRLVLRADLLAQSYELDEDVETLLSECVTGEATLRQIYKRSRLSRSRTFAVIFGLEAMQLVRFDAPTRFEHDDDSLRKWIEARTANPEAFDDFAFLGVSWLATGAELTEARERLERDLSQDRCQPLGGGLGAQASQVLERARALLDRLASPQARNTYRQEITAPGALSQAMSLMEGIQQIASIREDRATLRRIDAQLEELRGAAP